jgi:hypothetical protein
VIASLAGRRIDAPDADPERFPEELESRVAQRIADALIERRITTLVCAAACGSDLLALDAARRSGIAARVVLPYAIEDFRRSSVTDRGPGWGSEFDRLIGDAQERGEVRILGLDVHDPKAYEETNEAILDEALAIAGGDPDQVVALAVWDGAIPGRVDYTAAFAEAARGRGVRVESIPILR